MANFTAETVAWTVKSDRATFALLNEIRELAETMMTAPTDATREALKAAIAKYHA